MKIKVLSQVKLGQEVCVMYDGGHSSGIVKNVDGDNVTLEVTYKAIGKKLSDPMDIKHATAIRSLEKGEIFTINY